MYFEETYNKITEAERMINDSMLKLESVHPKDIIDNRTEVLTEAIIDKSKIDLGLKKIVEALNKVIEAFNDVTRKLKTKNSEWVARASQFQIAQAKLDGFEYEIFPYWNAIPELFNTQIPEFSLDLEQLLISDDGVEYNKQYFPKIIDKEGHVNKNILRGITDTSGDEKIKIDEKKAKALYPKFIQVIKSIHDLRNKVSNNAVMVSKTVNDSINDKLTINESTLLGLSMFKDEYYDILLEESLGEPETTDSIEKEKKEESGDNDNNDKDKKDIKVNSEENKGANKVKKSKELVKLWAKYSTAVTSAQMDILDEAYDECVRIVTKIVKYKKKDNNDLF